MSRDRLDILRSNASDWNFLVFTMILATAPSDNIYYITPTARKYQLIPPQGRKEGAWCYVAMVLMVLCCLLLSTPDNEKTILVGCRDRHHGFSTREKCPDRRSLVSLVSLVLVLSGLLVLRKKEQ